jgi:hypothetical protein
MGLNLINASNKSGEAVRASIAAIRSSGSTTITVDATTNWPTNFIATSGTLLADGTLNPSTAFVFAGHKVGSTIIIDTVAPGYTDAGNTVGQIVVIKPTTYWADNFADFLAINFNDNGSFTSTGGDNIATGLAGKSARLKPRLVTAASSATITPDISTANIYELSAQAAGLTIANPAGTPNDGDIFIIRIKDNGTACAIGFGTAYANVSGLDLITTTVINKWSYIGIQYNTAAAKWHIISISTEA